MCILFVYNSLTGYGLKFFLTVSLDKSGLNDNNSSYRINRESRSFKHTLTPFMSFLFTRRLLENGFILVKATLHVPVTEAIHNISYKYIVLKAERNKKGKPYILENLSGGSHKNRCLQIPKERCQTGSMFVYLFY